MYLTTDISSAFIFLACDLFDRILYMAEISEVYGSDYYQTAQRGRDEYVVNIISNNIANYNFDVKFHSDKNFAQLWRNSSCLPQSTIQEIITRTNQINADMKINHLNKNSSEDLKLIPYLIQDTAAEYFLIADLKKQAGYLIFISPLEMGIF